MTIRWRGAWFLVLLWAPVSAWADEPPLAEYFRVETAKLKARPLAGSGNAGEWMAGRPERQRQLREMLGLDPMPARGDLHARITGTIERPDFIVEKLLFQSSPGLYVTANLYRPKKVEGRLPAILYVCGHSKVEKDGQILGCKTHYQHHANWFAANGYVCLVLDTLQLGELPGLHHGTAREGMWWWQSRGYTPAGVEAWNAIRGIDYLVSRPEVDPSKIGVTGRSGGGATSWWVGAIDDRVAAVAPVAGITDLEDHVVDGVVEGHCDCMYFVNTYRWDFPTVAALVAPRPLLVVNTDKDPIFPEDGVRRIYAQLERVYDWYEARDRLGLVIGKGGHVDTPEIRHPTFAFFEKYLKGKTVDPSTIDEPDRTVPIEELKVLKPGEVPPYVRNGTIHETFVEASQTPHAPFAAEDWEETRARWSHMLEIQFLAEWRELKDRETNDGPARAKLKAADRSNVDHQGTNYSSDEFDSEDGVRVRRWWIITEGEYDDRNTLKIVVLDQEAWESGLGDFLKGIENSQVGPVDRVKEPWRGIIQRRTGPLLFVAPRGVGPSAWPASKDVQIRRRFALLGQTLDGRRAFDVLRAVDLLTLDERFGPMVAGVRFEESTTFFPLNFTAAGQAAPVALLASIFADREIKSVTLINPPTTWRDGPAFLGIDRLMGLPQAAALLYPHPLTLIDTPRESWTWTSDLSRRLTPGPDWPAFRDRPAR
jgi:dienelactone hydrolase